MLQSIARHGLTLPQYYLLRELFVEEGLTQRELSERLNTTEAATVLTLRGMEEAGLVERVRDAADRRKMRVSLAARGRRLRSALQRRATEVNAAMRRGLRDDEVARFRAILDHIERNLSESNDALT